MSIPFEEVICTQFVAVHFTWDSKYVVAVTSEPDWMLYYYNWESGKIESQTKAQNPNGQGRVTQVSCNIKLSEIAEMYKCTYEHMRLKLSTDLGELQSDGC